MVEETKSLRVLFCIAVLEEFFAAEDDIRAELVNQLKEEFGTWRGGSGSRCSARSTTTDSWSGR